MSDHTTAPTPRETGAERVVIEVMTVGMFSDGPNADACVCCPGAHRFGVEKRILSCTPPEAMPEAHYRRDLLSIISDFAWALPDQSRFTITLEQPTPRPDAASASVTEAMVEAAYRVMRDEYHDRALISPCSVRMSLEAALAAAPVPSASVTEVPRADLPKLDQPPESPGWRGDATVSAFRARLEVRIRETVDQVARVAGHAPGAKVNLKGFDSFLDCLCDAAAGAALAAAPRDAGREEVSEGVGRNEAALERWWKTVNSRLSFAAMPPICRDFAQWLDAEADERKQAVLTRAARRGATP